MDQPDLFASARQDVLEHPEQSRVDEVADLVAWLREQTWSDFAQSLAKQAEERGLSEKQISSAQSMRSTCNLKRATGKVKANSPAGSVQVRTEIPDGTYTVTFEDGTYRTLNLSTQADNAPFMPGKRLIGFLSGPDNERDFTTFGHIDGVRVIVWKRFRSESSQLLDALKVLVGDPAAAALAYAERSGRCARCRRSLTVPTSLHQGYGPECIKHVNP